MAIIDLDTGTLGESEATPTPGRIIDLETGAFTTARAAIPPSETPEAQAIAAQKSIDQPDISQLRPVPPVDKDDSALLRSVEQGGLNIGGGILRMFGELADTIGVEGAEEFLQELSTSQAMEQRRTEIITEDEPVQSFVGETIGETISFPFGGGGASLLTKILSGAAASGASGGLSSAGRGEETSGIAAEAGLGAVLSPLMEGVAAFRKFRKTGKQAEELGGVASEVEAIETAAQNLQTAVEAQAQTGVRTLPAQKTLDPFQLESQAFIGQNPEASTKAFNVLKEQNREAATAVDNLLNTIADPLAPSTSPAAARTAASNIIDAKKAIRTERSSPVYTESFREGADVDLTETKGVIKGILGDLPAGRSPRKSAINSVMGKLGGNPTLKQLHNAKLDIDELIEKTGEGSIGTTTKSELVQIQRQLLTAMDEASPLYSQARATFAENSPAVDQIRAGVFGRIADIKDQDLKRVSGIIFDATESNPEITRNAIRALKGVEGGQEIASGLLRTEIEKRLGRMKSDLSELSETGGRKLENVPANLLNNLFGNAKQKKMLMESLEELNPKAAKNARWLETSLIGASSGRPGGSQTGIRQVISQRLRGVSLGIRDFFRKPLDSLVGVGEEAQFSRRAAALGEALYNPDWAPDMNKIRKLDPNSPRAKSQFEKLLTSIVDANEKIRTSTQATTTAARQAAFEEEQE